MTAGKRAVAMPKVTKRASKGIGSIVLGVEMYSYSHLVWWFRPVTTIVLIHILVWNSVGKEREEPNKLQVNKFWR